MATTTTTKPLTPHVIFLPYAMTSHIMPPVHLARLFAAHGGLKVTIITTPHNALLLQSSVDHDHTMLGSNISVQTLKFPSDEVGLPEGVENYSASLSFEIALKIHYAFNMLQKPIEQLIRHLNPQCIVSDALFPWTVDLAEELHIPRFSFQPNNFFHQCVWHCLNESYIYRDQIDSDLFLIPGLPHEIKMKNSEIEEFFKKETYVWKILKSVMGADLRSHGIIHNTCSELEPGYAQYYEEIRGGTKIWHVGPIALFINTLESSEGTISNSIILDTTSSSSCNNLRVLVIVLNTLELDSAQSILISPDIIAAGISYMKSTQQIWSDPMTSEVQVLSSLSTHTELPKEWKISVNLPEENFMQDEDDDAMSIIDMGRQREENQMEDGEDTQTEQELQDETNLCDKNQDEFVEIGERNNQIVLYDEHQEEIPLNQCSSEDLIQAAQWEASIWVHNRVISLSKELGVDFDGLEGEALALFMKIDQRRQNKEGKDFSDPESNFKQSREVKNLVFGVKFKGGNSRARGRNSLSIDQ